MNSRPIDLYLDLPSQRSHVVNWGGLIGAPTILLIHGAASNAKMWNLVAPDLSRDFRVVACDQRSHGETSAPTANDFSFAAVCSDIHVVCKQMAITRPIVVGHSWGGNIALEYAARHPANIAAIVMIEGGFAGMNKIVTWPQFEKMVAPPRLKGTPLSEYLERAKRNWGDYFNTAVLDELMGNVEVCADQTIAPHLSFDNLRQIQHATWEQDADTLYAQVKSPALFLQCLPTEPHDLPTKQILAWKQKTATHIRSLIPQAQIEWLADSHHDVPLQRPALIADKIRAFVESSL